MKEIKIKLSIDNLEQAKKEINTLCAKDRKIKIDVDTQGITKSINSLNQSVINLQKQLGIRTVFNIDTDTSNKGMREISGSIQKITQELNSMSGRGFQELQARANELLQTTNQIAKTDIKVDKNGNLQKAIVTYTNEMGQLSKETMGWVTKLDEAGNKTQVFEVVSRSVSDNAQAIQKATQNLETFKATMNTKLIKLEEMGFDTAKLEEFRNKLNSLDLTTTNVQYGILRDAIREATTEMNKFSTSVDKAKTSMSNTLEGIQNLRQLEGLRTANVEKLAQQVNSISTKSSQAEIDALQQKVNNLDKSTQQVIKLREAQSQLSSAIKSVSSLEFIKSGEEAKVKQATQSLEDMQKAMKSISQGKPIGDVDFTKLTNGAKGLSTELQNIANQSIKTQEQIAKVQQTLQNTLSKSMTKGFIDDSVFKDLQSRIDSLNVKNFSTQITQLTNDINSLSKVDSAIMRVQNAIETLSNKIKAVQNTSDNSEQSINAIKLAEAEIQKLQDVLTQLKTTGKLDGKNLVDSQQISSQINTIRNSVNSYLTDVQKANTNAKLKIDISDAQAKLDAFKNNSFFNGDYISKLQSKLNSLNTDTPEQEVKSLQKEINNLSSTATTIGRLESQYKKLAEAIKAVTSSGTLKMDSNELVQAENSLRKLQDAITQLKSTGKIDGNFVVSASTNKLLNEASNNTKTLENSVKNVKNTVSGTTTQVTSFAQSFSRIASSMGIFISLQQVIRQLFEQFKNGVEYVRYLDEAFTDISITMDMTKSQFSEMTDQVQQMAVQLGTSSEAVMDVVKTYANAQSNIDEVMQKTQPSVILSNLSGMDTSSVTKAVNATLNAFDMLKDGEADVIEQTTRVSDVIVSVSQNMQYDFNDGIVQLIDGVKTAGNVAESAGVSFESYVARMGTLIETTGKSGSELANAYKMIVARTFQMKSLGEELGIASNEMGNAGKALDKLDISIKNSDGSLKSMDEILQLVADQWGGLTQADKQFVAEMMAGNRHRSTFNAIMDSMSNYTEKFNVALESNGTSMEAQNKYMDSFEGKLGSLKANMEALYSSMLNSDFLKGFIDSLNNGITGITNFTKKFGTITTVLTPVLTCLLTFNKHIKTMANTMLSSIPGISNLVGKFTAYKTSLQNSIATQKTYIAKLQAQKTAAQEAGLGTADLSQQILKANSSLGWMELKLLATNVAMSALSGGISLLVSMGLQYAVNKFREFKDTITPVTEDMDKFRNTVDTLNSSMQEASDVDNLINSYATLSRQIEELDKVGDESSIEKRNELLEQQNGIREELIGIDSQYAEVLGDENLTLDEQLGKMHEINEAAKQLALKDAFEGLANQGTMERTFMNLGNQIRNYKAMQDALNEAGEKTTITFRGMTYSVDDFKVKMTNTKTSVAEGYEAITEYNNILELAEENNYATGRSMLELDADTQAMYDSMWESSSATSSASEGIEGVGDSANGASDDLAGLSDTADEVDEALARLAETADLDWNQDGILDMTDNLLNLASQADDTKTALENLSSIWGGYETEIELLDTMLSDLEEYGALQEETWSSVMKSGNADIIALLGDEDNMYQKLIDTIQAKKKAQEDAENAAITAAQEEQRAAGGLTDNLAQQYSDRSLYAEDSYRSQEYATLAAEKGQVDSYGRLIKKDDEVTENMASNNADKLANSQNHAQSMMALSDEETGKYIENNQKKMESDKEVEANKTTTNLPTAGASNQEETMAYLENNEKKKTSDKEVAENRSTTNQTNAQASNHQETLEYLDNNEKKKQSDKEVEQNRSETNKTNGQASNHEETMKYLENNETKKKSDQEVTSNKQTEAQKQSATPTNQEETQQYVQNNEQKKQSDNEVTANKSAQAALQAQMTNHEETMAYLENNESKKSSDQETASNAVSTEQDASAQKQAEYQAERSAFQEQQYAKIKDEQHFANMSKSVVIDYVNTVSGLYSQDASSFTSAMNSKHSSIYSFSSALDVLINKLYSLVSASASLNSALSSNLSMINQVNSSTVKSTPTTSSASELSDDTEIDIVEPTLSSSEVGDVMTVSDGGDSGSGFGGSNNSELNPEVVPGGASYIGYDGKYANSSTTASVVNNISTVTNSVNNLTTSVEKLATSASNLTSATNSATSASKEASDTTEKEVADLELKIDRYYKLNDVIEDYNDLLEINSKLQADQSNANKKYSLMREEIQLMQEKMAVLQKLQQEQEKERNEIKKILAWNKFTFDSYGNLTNSQERLEAAMKWVNTLSGEYKEQQKAWIEQLAEYVDRYTTLMNDDIESTKQQIMDLNNSIKSTAVETLTTLRDKLVEALRSQTETEKENELARLDDRIALLRKQIDDMDDEYGDKVKRQAKLEAELEKWKLDDSATGKKKVAELMDEIAELQKDIAKMEVEKQIEDIEKQQDAISNAYDEQLQDKELYYQADKLLAENNINEIKKLLESNSEDFRGLGNLLGESFKESFMEEIQFALDSIKYLKGQTNALSSTPTQTTTVAKKPTTTPNNSTSSSSSSSSSNKTTTTASSTTLPVTKGSRVHVSSPSSAIYVDSYTSSASGTWSGAGISANDTLYVVNDNNGRVALSRKQGDVYSAIGWIDKNKVKAFNIGGYTGNSEGLAWLDKQEQVLTKEQTSAFQNLVKILPSLVSNPYVELVQSTMSKNVTPATENAINITNNNTYNVTPKTEYDTKRFEQDVETLMLKDLRKYGKVKGR
ncbi:MAG: phage tail tape measure protein [Romboutsia timonensis]